MNQKHSTLLAFALLVLAAALYRIVPGRPYGFDPMIAMAIFGGAVISNKKWAFALPLAAMLLSDALFEGLTRAGITNMPGLYDGQWLNYILLGGLSFFGIFMKQINLRRIAVAALSAPLVYFLLSNTGTWMFHGGFQRPISFNGWLMALTDGLPFLKWSMASSLFFSVLFFGCWYLLPRHQEQAKAQHA
ncbi:MAG: hypothetical protein JST06_06300 [Bacteroidetes bacterium]|nr:hypothetical protein [Bacteroidota bacterium]MBS1629219.1 hypothetical protein [Bacteroidota bacterium]